VGSVSDQTRVLGDFFISLLIFKFASDLYSIGTSSGAVAQASHIAHCNNGIPKFSALRAEDFFRRLRDAEKVPQAMNMLF